MENEFVEYQQAKGLKELGFNKYCFAYYGFSKKLFYLDYKDAYNLKELVPAPLYQQAFCFLREHYSYRFYILPCSQHKKYVFEITLPSSIVFTSMEDNAYETYEKAEKSLLNKLIEVIKSNSLVTKIK